MLLGCFWGASGVLLGCFWGAFGVGVKPASSSNLRAKTPIIQLNWNSLSPLLLSAFLFSYLPAWTPRKTLMRRTTRSKTLHTAAFGVGSSRQAAQIYGPKPQKWKNLWLIITELKLFLVLKIMRHARCKYSAPTNNERIFFVSIRDSYRYEYSILIISNPDFGCFLWEKWNSTKWADPPYIPPLSNQSAATDTISRSNRDYIYDMLKGTPSLL